MAENKTDYTKPRTDLIELLPEPLQSDVNLSIFDNIFNRYLSKQEIEKVAGYIGQGNPNALRSRQIHEANVHRQGFQLQPIPHNKIGSVEHMTSWKDMQNSLERLGVDVDDFDDWGTTEKFNWVPPVDINKIINYRDYYWVDKDEPRSTPQYITIRNTCSTATARFNFWDGLVSQFGSTMPIEKISASIPNLKTLPITDFPAADELRVEGDVTDDILINDLIDIIDTAANDGTYLVNRDPVYSGVTNETIIKVSTSIAVGSPVPSAKISLRRFDEIVLGANATLSSGDYTGLFEEGFLFFVRNSTNVNLDNTFVEVISSTYDTNKLQTIVIVNHRITDDTADGEVSLEEQLSIYEADKQCQCGEFGGWDTAQWDDNPDGPLWGDDETLSGSPVSDGISDHTNLIARISKTTPPVSGVGTKGELWYDTVTNILYQADLAIEWVVIWRNFSLILAQTTGIHLWDLSLSCDLRPRIEGVSQWTTQNHWIHKSDIDNFATIARASIPIIEYDWDLELNEWTYSSYNWSYKAESDFEYSSSSITPPRIELEPLIWWEHTSVSDTTITLDDRYGDLTDYFSEGKQVFFVFGLLKSLYVVESSSYKTDGAGYPYRTHVTFNNTPPTFTVNSLVVTENLKVQAPNAVSIIPTKTIMGDEWEDYDTHWRFDGVNDAVPVPHQNINPFIELKDGLTPSPVGSPLQYEYITSLYAQNYLLVESTNSFALTGSVSTTTTRPLTRKALFGHDDLRVYVSDLVGEEVIREIGTYDEIGEVVFNILGVDYAKREFIIGDPLLVDFTPTEYFKDGDEIRISDNISVNSPTFTVDGSASPAPFNRIKVNEDLSIVAPNLTEHAPYGNISNVSNPVRPEAGIGFTNTQNITVYAVGVEFPITAAIPEGKNVQIVVGESAIDEIGNGNVHVNTTAGIKSVSLTEYRIVEQIKTKTNQYPLFDIFTVEGNPAYDANPIFGYKTSTTAPINNSVGLRIVHDAVNDIFSFDQFLLEEDNGELFAYRDYANKQNDYWFNKETNELKFWNEITWSDKTIMSDDYRRAIVSSVEPASTADLNTQGLYWYNTTTDVLFIRNTPTNSWLEITGVDQLITDANLQTIWKSGKTDTLYIPDKVDWFRRSEAEYDAEKSIFVTTYAEDLIAKDPSMSEPDAIAEATVAWHESQVNHISSSGTWVGDWEIPAPLYYNHLHENRKCITSRELFTHFTTIIEEQESVPGWNGTKDGQFNIVHINEIDYGVGGTIKEFNNGFDTLISTTMVNNVTPPSLFEFAHDQYLGLLNTLKELYRKNAVDVLADVNIENVLNVSPLMASTIIDIYELNDNTAFLYGDTTTFTDNAGINDVGVRNWIATLPYLNMVHRIAPERIIDSALNLNEVVHHDGHRDSYEITAATADIIAKTLIALPDPRFTSETLGTASSSTPANTVSEFESALNTITNREGVYWQQTTTVPRTLYRYVVAVSGTTEPALSYDDGTLWMDLLPGLEVLRIKKTNSIGVESWDVVDGLIAGDGRLHNGTDPLDTTTATVSAWQVVDLDVILGDIIFELENRLYDNVDDVRILNYDFEETKLSNEIKFTQYNNEAFLSYISQNEIDDALKNTDFDATNPYTWNYKRSAPGGVTTILSSDDLTNSFVVVGDKTTSFTTAFYVKNSSVNDGRWVVIVSVFDGTHTTIYVEGDVKDGVSGSIYIGILPSPIDDFLPNNLNDGSESGGDWHDLYEKFYGTPYPHLEPWVLQGYTSEPIWWDSEYLNNDRQRWGDRKWKYKHGFDIKSTESVVGSPTSQSLTIDGEFLEVFTSSTILVIDDTTAAQGSPPATYTIETLETIHTVNPGIAGTASFVITDTGFASATYTTGMKISITNAINAISGILNKTYVIKTTNLSGSDFTIIVEEEILVGDIVVGIDFINGAVYSIATNKTVIYTDIPVLINSSPIDGRIAATYGMWENIRIGRIPAGQPYPNGVVSVTGNPASEVGLSVEELPRFNYFSVNIDNVDVTTDGGITNISPDGILPPYWDYTEMYTNGTLNNMVRSLYYNFNIEIISPNVDYTFGDSGPIEWEWKSSAQYLYDQLTVAYRLDPSRFIYSVFGFNFTSIGGLLIDRDVRNTASHSRTNFHGDVVNNLQFISNGINQWYVNYNRYLGYDTNFSDFQSLWTLWTAPLTYQFASYVDTPSLSVGHRYIDLTDFDYNVISKLSRGLDDFWLDAFNVQILNVPYDLSRYNNELDWRFSVKTNLLRTRHITYHDVHNYQFQANPATNECSLYTWNIKAVNSFDNEFSIAGDHVDIFAPNREFVVSNSTGNDGTYSITSAVYDVVQKITTIRVNFNISSPLVNGNITLVYRTIPWETGYAVYLSTTEIMPVPLDSDTVIGTTKYFIIKTSPTTFKVANTLADALAGTEIPITTAGTGDHFVGELLSTFDVTSSGDTLWRQYTIDETNLLSWSTPKQIQGMQNLIDAVRGYESYIKASGWGINSDRSLRDADTSEIVSWQVELERFVNFSYDIQSKRTTINNRYEVTTNPTQNEFTFTTANRVFITGDTVVMVSDNNVYPYPLTAGLQYYIIRDELDTIKLASSRTDAAAGIEIDILPTTGVGSIFLTTSNSGRFIIPPFEINPFRNAVWFNQPSGIVSNVLAAPITDVSTTQTIFDQKGDAIQVDQLRVYRRDAETKIIVKDVENIKQEVTFVSDDYNFIHLGGLHIFTDSYEHAMLFNNYSAGDNLLYDPFIGLNVTKYEMLFNRNPEFTGRPNVGGYYLETFFNQGASIKENFEAGVENLRNAYDTYDTLESNLMTLHSRDTLGYDGIVNYLADLNISEKSQFVFWRGQIQSKGSINAINAYINSRRFIDAKIDEFWAIKVADFGSSKEKEYPEMFTTTVDARTNEFKVEFICSEDDGSNITDGFTPVRLSDTERWYNQPEQLEILRDNGKLMYFDMKIINKLDGEGSPSLIKIDDNGYINHNLDVDVVSITKNGADFTNFEYINPDVIKLTGSPLPNLSDLIISGYVVNDDVNNPSRLIDRGAETQLSTIEFWDPARGHHYSLAIHNVDLQKYDDPAIYEITPQIIANSNTWASEFVGTSWMDVSTMDYIPYHSDKVITDNDTRFREWGQLHDFASVNLYEWVESDVPPTEWDAISAVEEGDNTILESERKAGIAKFTLFEPEVAGSPVTSWVPLKNKVDTQYAALNPAGTFIVDDQIIDTTKAVDVYVNESKQPTVQPTGSPATLQSISLTVKENDIVKFVQAVPTDVDVIAAEVAAGNLLQEYEYTTVQEYDSFGALSTKYYFWVGNKGTKPLDRNRLMSLAEAEQQLVSVPSTYMFYQKPTPREFIVDSGNLVDRTEYFTVSEDGVGTSTEHNYNLALTANENSTLTVDIGGVRIDDVDVTITTPATIVIPETGFDITHMYSPDFVEVDVTDWDETGSGTGFIIKDDGTQIWFCHSGGGGNIYTASLTEPYELSSIVLPPTVNTVGAANFLNITMNPTGTVLMLQTTAWTVKQYAIDPPWDLSGATLVQDSPAIFDPVGSSSGSAYFSRNGLHAYVGTTTNRIYSFTLSTAWDISTATQDASSLSLTGHATYGRNTYVSISEDGTKLFHHDFDSLTPMNEWALSTPFDRSTATWTKSSYMQGNTARRGIWSDGGLHYYTTTDSDLYHYKTGFGDGSSVTIQTTNVTIDQPVEGSPEQDVRISYVGTYSSVLPTRFTQVIIRGLQGIIFDDSRYTIRFTRDFTLRNTLDVDDESIAPLDLNNLHEEWKIFRQEQEQKIDRWMWDKITESIVGYQLSDTSVRVPSYEYELYDEKFDTDTQYGIGVNQTFVNGTLALSSVLAYLEDPGVDFNPIDINAFFVTYKFDDADAIIAGMDNIYNTFTVTNINRIYFSVLHDAFTAKAKYPGIFKTSMVSLHGIRPLTISGIFDD